MKTMSTMKTFTLQGHCKKCDADFTYERTGNLMGAERSVCDQCRDRRNSAKMRISPRWRRVVAEREE